MTHPNTTLVGKTMTAIQERALAAELIKRRMRLSFVAYLFTKINKSDPSDLWKELHPGEPTPCGRPPDGSSHAMKTAFERACGAAMLKTYLEYCGSPSNPTRRVIDPASLCMTWDSLDLRLKRARPQGCDINLMYLLARDYVAKQVSLVKCPDCHASYLRHVGWVAQSKYMNCPHCDMTHQSK